LQELEYEWDPEKAAQVARDHGVTFDEARSVFEDPFAATRSDPEHSRVEPRDVTIGVTHQGRTVVVAHTRRGRRFG
jgi:uncharacterized DUF497 family protein